MKRMLPLCLCLSLFTSFSAPFAHAETATSDARLGEVEK